MVTYRMIRIVFIVFKTILPDEMRPRGGFILPETLVLAGLEFPSLMCVVYTDEFIPYHHVC